MGILQRLKVYGIGLILGCIIMFSVPKLRNNFLQYVNWGDSNQWVINDLKYEFHENYDSKISYSDIVKNKLEEKNLETNYLLKVLDRGWENREERKRLAKGFTLFVIDNKVNGEGLSVHFNFNEDEHKIIVSDFFCDQELSKKSYFSYFAIFLIFLIIMVPTILLIKRMTRKRRMQDE